MKQFLNRYFDKIVFSGIVFGIIGAVWSYHIFDRCAAASSGSFVNFCPVILLYVTLPSFCAVLFLGILWFFARKAAAARVRNALMIFSVIAVAALAINLCWIAYTEWRHYQYSAALQKTQSEFKQSAEEARFDIINIRPEQFVVEAYPFGVTNRWHVNAKLHVTAEAQYGISFISGFLGDDAKIVGSPHVLRKVGQADNLIGPQQGCSFGFCPTTVVTLMPGDYEAEIVLYPEGWKVKDGKYCIMGNSRERYTPKPTHTPDGSPIAYHPSSSSMFTPAEFTWLVTIGANKLSQNGPLHAGKEMKGAIAAEPLPQNWDTDIRAQGAHLPDCE